MGNRNKKIKYLIVIFTLSASWLLSFTACDRGRKNLEAELMFAARGKQLLFELNCVGCHFIKGFSPEKKQGPILAGIGSKVSYQWLVKWLKNPKDYLPNTPMPRYELSDEHANALAAYLMTCKDESDETGKEVSEGDSEEGGNLARLVRCISCHPFNGTGGHLAPDIGKIGNKVTKKWLYEMLKNPKRFQPETTMPQFTFSDRDLKNLVAWLFEEYTDYEIAESEAQEENVKNVDPLTIDTGRRIYKELRCSNCHDLEPNEKWLQLGPVLTNIGDKKVKEFNYGNSSIARRSPDYIFEKIRNPKAFESKTNLVKMPNYGLSDWDAKDITFALLGFRSIQHDSGTYSSLEGRYALYEPQGEVGILIEKYKCFSCHSIKGRGYNLAYDLSMEGSRVKRKWLYDYLMMSYSIRPILVERMPVFRFTADEAKILTDYIMSELLTDSLETGFEKELTSEMTKNGKILFEEKGCMACHIVEDKGGYVGPSFTIGTLVGDKLQAGWIYAWLKNPQAIKPDVLEPNYHFSDEDAKAITAYLMSLRK